MKRFTVEDLKDSRRSRDYTWGEMMDLYDTAIVISELNVKEAKNNIAMGGIALVVFFVMVWLCSILF